MNEAFLAHLTAYACNHDPDMAINREDWLNNALDLFRGAFQKIGTELPQKIRVSCGFPKGRSKAIGQVWAHTASKDGHFEIFISPEIADPSRALDILLHEVCHVAAGIEAGHKGAFKRCALAVGLSGKMTATVASGELKSAFENGVIPNLGEYPHAELSGANTGRKKQKTRMLKLICPQCGDKIRAARKSIEHPKACLCQLIGRNQDETVTIQEVFSMVMELDEGEE